MMKAVIFDMDGVIINSEIIYHEVEMSIFKELGLGISEEERYSYVGTKTYDMWTDIKEKYPLRQTVDELVELESRRFMDKIRVSTDIRPIDGVADLISELHSKGVKLAVASSSHMEEIELIIGTFGITGYFDFLVSGDQVKNGKPAPDIFLLAAKLLGISPEECIVIEDSKNGVSAAKQAGMKCIGFQNPGSGNQDLSCADRIINNFYELSYEELKRLWGTGYSSTLSRS